MKVKIPSSIFELIDVFSEKGYTTHKIPIDAKHVLEDLFLKTKSLVSDVNCVYHVVDNGDIFHVWIVQSEKWYLKSWRKQIARNFQLREFADQLVFFVNKVEFSQKIEKYALLVITELSVDSIDEIVPENPSSEIERLWEQIHNKNFSLSEYIPISIYTQASHELTAKNLFNSLNKDKNEVLHTFSEVGITIVENRIIIPSV